MPSKMQNKVLDFSFQCTNFTQHLHIKKTFFLKYLHLHTHTHTHTLKQLFLMYISTQRQFTQTFCDWWDIKNVSGLKVARVWIHGSRFFVPVTYYTQLKDTIHKSKQIFLMYISTQRQFTQTFCDHYQGNKKLYSTKWDYTYTGFEINHSPRWVHLSPGKYQYICTGHTGEC